MTVFLAQVIYFCYLCVGKADKLVTIYDYPKFYQRIFMKSVAKEAGRRQQVIIDECLAMKKASKLAN